MEVKLKQDNVVRFRDMDSGSLFAHRNALFIKSFAINGGNSMRLGGDNNQGGIALFEGHEPVRPVEGYFQET